MPTLELRRNIHNVPDVDPAMIAWSRLPTPIPHAAASIASTPSSTSPSSAYPAPKLLSICTSSVADGLLPSPLPSPRESSTSGGSKTAAFFSSPFAAAGPPPPAPPPPPSRRETNTVVSNPKESVPARSATADFFAVSSMGARPTPPPSVKSSASSREPSPPRLPPLSRIFPSRYASERTLSMGEEEPLSPRNKGTDWETNFKREFLNLTEAAAQLPPSPPFTTTSPTQMNPMSPPMERLQLPNPRVHHPHAQSAPIRRETHLVGVSRRNGESGFEEAISGGTPTLISGTHLESGTAQLTLVRALGEGAFSSVWLASDDGGTLPSPSESRSHPETLRRKSSSWAKKGRDKRMHGITPPATTNAGFSWKKTGSASDPDGSVVLDEQDGEGAIASADDPAQTVRPKGRLVAVKMINRALCDANDRTRISFVREVEVLRHIAHPSIVAYLHSFTSDSHHCLVLEHVGGGELFDLVNSDMQFAQVTEAAVRRMWGELCRAVGWMHGVGLVHRDIKLENILLTRNIFATNEPLPLPNTPLIKLTDFGLSRFIDPTSPLLSTRCGSESYAAPELVLGGSSARAATSDSDSSESGEPKGYYDGRQTDAWACGVVLYALATRQLPFDAPPPLPMSYSAAPSRAGSIRSTRSNRSGTSGSVRLRTTNRRRDMLMRIAQCEYYWPDEIHYGDDGPGEEEEEEVDPPVEAARRLASPGLKRVVRRLLERSQARRVRMVDLWDEPWLRGEGAPAPPFCAAPPSEEAADGIKAEGEDETEWPAHDGILLDSEHIDSVASQELDPL